MSQASYATDLDVNKMLISNIVHAFEQHDGNFDDITIYSKDFTKRQNKAAEMITTATVLADPELRRRATTHLNDVKATINTANTGSTGGIIPLSKDAAAANRSNINTLILNHIETAYQSRYLFY